MKTTKPFAFATLIALCASAPFAATGISSYQQLPPPSKQKYAIHAWPRGSETPVRFVSGFYRNDTSVFVRLDDKSLVGADNSKIRFPADFDSLNAAKVPTTWPIPTDAEIEWLPASVIDGRWMFPRIAGKVSLYSSEPSRGLYHYMDTGAGLEPIQPEVLRTKIRSNTAAAKILRDEKIGHVAAWTMAIGGGSLAAIGAVSNLTGATTAENANTITLLGLGIAAISWIPHLSVEGNFQEAIRAYNAAQATNPTAR